MSRRPSRSIRALVPAVLVLGSGLGMGMPVGAQSPHPVGGEFEVNNFTPNSQAWPSVAADAEGNFIVVWQSQYGFGTDFHRTSVQGQRFASNGSPQGAQFQVNTYTTSYQGTPQVASEADGDFIVVWDSFGSLGSDTSLDSIQGQRYASDGSPRGGEFQVNSYTTNAQGSPSLAVDEDGDLVVVWGSNGSSGTDASGGSIQGQRYASDGSTQGGEFQINTYTTNHSSSPSVAMQGGGDFVVAWVSFGSSGTDTSEWSIQGQRYASDGSTRGGEFQVNSYTTSAQGRPSVAARADGGFVMLWDSSGSPGSDTSLSSIQAQRYASDGVPIGGQFQVNTYTTDGQFDPVAAAHADGSFVVAWVSAGSSGTDNTSAGLFFGSRSIQGRVFASDGSPRGAQFQVNTYTTNHQVGASAASAPGGGFVVTWSSQGSFGWDSSGDSIQGQLYSGSAPAAVPSLAFAGRLALGTALMLLGAALVRAYGSVSRRSRFSR